MPVVHTSTIKRARQAEQRRLRNKGVLSRVKGVVKKVRIAIQEKDGAATKTQLHAAQVALNKAASKGVMHRNTAARRVSRLARAANALTSSSS
ncbi:MAG TPA: 30S ribosomal protein S20 [Nitrospirales bacterium]|nr:30S ribosomal protein S20 [Nitrospirales bacterium]HIA14446.1 30S ribosomal protein S20 [Nitrospirales bacterium]HIB54399.1 30S ribosomal protein S20 [Nitrospirales bacterium]HIC05155.1 30S ribosomal protein S20 [Nitrospirales bacterium]HIN34039.1 30S ribosomal protein S20 [Nitrospirales bacterium]